MTSDKAADRLAWLVTTVLTVSIAWGNGWAMLAVSIACLSGSALFWFIAFKSLSRAAVWTLLASVLTSATVALIAWKVKL